MNFNDSDLTHKCKHVTHKYTLRNLQKWFPCSECPIKFNNNCNECHGKGLNINLYQNWVDRQSNQSRRCGCHQYHNSEKTHLINKLSKYNYQSRLDCQINFLYTLYLTLFISSIVIQGLFLVIEIKNQGNLDLPKILVMVVLSYQIILGIVGLTVYYFNNGFWLLYYFQFEVRINRHISFYLMKRENQRVYKYPYLIPLVILVLLDYGVGIYLYIKDQHLNCYYISVYVALGLSLVILILELILVHLKKKKIGVLVDDDSISSSESDDIQFTIQID